MKNPAFGQEGSPIYGGHNPVLRPSTTSSLHLCTKLTGVFQDRVDLPCEPAIVSTRRMWGGALQFWGGIIASEAGHGFSTGM